MSGRSAVKRPAPRAASRGTSAGGSAKKTRPHRDDSIKKWPISEQPREKLIRHGAEHLTDSELLAITIRVGVPGVGAVTLGRRLLQELGSLHQLKELGVTELASIHGIGLAKAAQIKAAIELGSRAQNHHGGPRPCFRSSTEVAAYLGCRLEGLKQEQFVVLLLDGKHRLLHEEVVSKGTLSASIVHPRDVFREAIRRSSAAVILVHNHPSGDPQPSEEDIQLTERLVNAGQLLGIKVLDHLIVGQGRYRSLAESGELVGRVG